MFTHKAYTLRTYNVKMLSNVDVQFCRIQSTSVDSIEVIVICLLQLFQSSTATFVQSHHLINGGWCHLILGCQFICPCFSYLFQIPLNQLEMKTKKIVFVYRTRSWIDTILNYCLSQTPDLTRITNLILQWTNECCWHIFIEQRKKIISHSYWYSHCWWRLSIFLWIIFSWILYFFFFHIFRSYGDFFDLIESIQLLSSLCTYSMACVKWLEYRI